MDSDHSAGESPPVRLAILTQRVSDLTRALERGDRESVTWRRDVAADLSQLKEAYRVTTSSLEHVETQIEEVKLQLASKLGVEGLRGIWKVVLGSTVLISAVGGLVTILKAVHLVAGP